MSTEQALQTLWARLHALRETVVALRLTAVEDRPRQDRTAYTDRLADAVDDLAAPVVEAFNTVAGALPTAGDGAAARDALAAVHAALARAHERHWRALGEPSAHAELDRVRRRGERWAAWVSALRRGADDLPLLLARADDALRRAWLELTDRTVIAEPQTTTTVKRGGTT